MASTKFIGYEISKGDFTNEKTGEVIEYSNRNLTFITDTGADEKHVGFAPFQHKKVKMVQLASWLNVKDDDKAVDNALNSMIGKPVTLDLAPRNGELALVGIRLAKS